ncbi:hypothetical protein PM082_006799 [Marasmius tenuissimus]|nr:hypothetical protein PM082_006799 [Marasmius tenuissimus]
MEQVASYWTWIGLGAGILTIVCQCLRKALYPCLTRSELENASNCLKAVYTKHNDLVSPPFHDEYHTLQTEASEIVVKHLQESALWTYIGFNPGLIPEIVRWYDRSEEWTRGILLAHEKDKQSRYEAERRRIQAIRQAVPDHYSSAYENPCHSVVNNRGHTFTVATELNVLRSPSATSGARDSSISTFSRTYTEYTPVVDFRITVSTAFRLFLLS